tara:strand:- start:187 stop:585 length:399 start_codon:yes stop_codon:yes gene_type:complete
MREKVFFAMPRNQNRWFIPDLRMAKLRLEQMTNKDLDICLSSEVFEEFFEGDWNHWIENVVSGVDYYTRRPKYGSVVCITKEVGKATAQIVMNALAQQKPVFLFDGNDMQIVGGIETIDSQNWQSGWKLIKR